MASPTGTYTERLTDPRDTTSGPTGGIIAGGHTNPGTNTGLGTSGNPGHTGATVAGATGHHDIEKGHRYDDNNLDYRRQPGFPAYPRNGHRANPDPLGLFAFATSTLLFSLINAHARHVSQQNISIGMAFFMGGLAQFVAGIFEFCVGNTFGMTAFCGFGAFYFSVAVSYWPTSAAFAPYSPTNADLYQLNAALGLFYICWFVFALVLWLGTFRSSYGLSATFFFWWLSLVLLASGYMAASVGATKASGWIGVITALSAFYTGVHSFLTREHSPFQPPNPSLVRNQNHA